MEQGHGRIQQPFSPTRQPNHFGPIRKEPAPMSEQQYPSRNGIEQSALGHEQGQWDRCPWQLCLEILQLPTVKKLHSSQTTIEQKGSHDKRSAKEEQRTESKN